MSKISIRPFRFVIASSLLITTTVCSGRGEVVLVGAGDIGFCKTSYQKLTAELILGMKSNIVFTAGDNAQERGLADEYKKCYDPWWGKFKSRTRPSPGNHDYGTPGAVHYFAYFGSKADPSGLGYYSYTAGTWHVVSLNSNIGDSKAQKDWLVADLRNHPAQCILAYWHHPLFTSGPPQYAGDGSHMKAVWDILYRFRADIVVNGHMHEYERFVPQNPAGKSDPTQGIRQFIVGTGGTCWKDNKYAWGTIKPNSEVRDNSSLGVLKLTLQDGSYKWAFMPVGSSRPSDSGTSQCTKPCIPDGTCSAPKPNCGEISRGKDSCGNPCMRKGGPCDRPRRCDDERGKPCHPLR